MLLKKNDRLAQELSCNSKSDLNNWKFRANPDDNKYMKDYIPHIEQFLGQNFLCRNE
jgi:hypothetical protein